MDSRNYLQQPYDIHDLASTAGYEVRKLDGSFDFTWYSDSQEYNVPNIESVVISRNQEDIDAEHSTTPSDYVLVGFIDINGKQYLVTYADGYGFEYTSVVAWGRVIGVWHRLTTKSDFLSLLEYLNISNPAENDFQG